VHFCTKHYTKLNLIIIYTSPQSGHKIVIAWLELTISFRSMKEMVLWLQLKGDSVL